ncbi:MAG: sugar ABC transporter permease [Devosia sp.]|uniref:carbohydrate ABC transporter permease n=1 Tax=Devosia sp. TaxID=1871048 RepID=UPI001A5DD663|nr:sugar ABC transporter permease [Devosia sp.]MBL8598945.1 sugar ABC transporter permease [Devosia sp.]
MAEFRSYTAAVPPDRAGSLQTRSQRVPRGGRSRYPAQNLIAGFVLVSPQAIGFGLFVFLPIVAVLVVSFLDWNLLTNQISIAGLNNYTERLPSDTRFAGILGNTAVFLVGYVPTTVVGGLALAVLTNGNKPGMQVYRAVFFVPVVVSLAAWAVIWKLMFQPEGPINAVLKLFGIIGPNWLANSQVAMVAIIIVSFIKSVGFTMVLFHAALQNVPRDVLEAARIDGAGEWARFWYITLPLIAPFTFLIVILNTISSFNNFALFYVMTRGGPGDATRILPLYIYDMGFKFLQLGYTGTLSVLLFAIVLVLTVAQFLVRRRWVHNET